VRGLREHVGDPRRGEPIALLVHQHRGVARQGRRVARHIHDPRWPA